MRLFNPVQLFALCILCFQLLPTTTFSQTALRKASLYIVDSRYEAADLKINTYLKKHPMDAFAWYLLSESSYLQTRYLDSLYFTAWLYAYKAKQYSAVLDERYLIAGGNLIDAKSIQQWYDSIDTYVYHRLLDENKSVLFDYFLANCRGSTYYSLIKAHCQNDTDVESQTIALSSHPEVVHIRGYLGLLNETDSTKLYNWRAGAVRYADVYPDLVYIKSDTLQAFVALTFDDGPEAVITPALLDTLLKYHVKATFFCLGKQIEKYPEITQRIVDEGHLLLSHSYDHPRFVNLDSSSIALQLARTHTLISRYVSGSPLWVRPPYGHITEREITWMHQLGYKSILWSLDACDWINPPPDAKIIAQNVVINIEKGDVVLMHLKPNTLSALPLILTNLERLKYKAVRLDELNGL